MVKVMKRIYFLVPNLKTTHLVVAELRSKGIEDRYIHVLAKRDTPLEDLPEATLIEKTDFIPAVERGAALGATTGLLAGLIALRAAGFAIAGGSILGILFFGASIGSIASGLIGLRIGNSKLKKYEQAIENGELLVIIDIPKERIGEISKAIVKHHPTVEFEGMESMLPPPY